MSIFLFIEFLKHSKPSYQNLYELIHFYEELIKLKEVHILAISNSRILDQVEIIDIIAQFYKIKPYNKTLLERAIKSDDPIFTIMAFSQGGADFILNNKNIFSVLKRLINHSNVVFTQIANTAYTKLRKKDFLDPKTIQMHKNGINWFTTDFRKLVLSEISDFHP